MKNDLAIIIPAYKTAYFEETLKSLAQQTVKRFTVYIGDDGSKEDFLPIVEAYSNELEIHYRKFSNNLGQTDLVAHWKRCIAMANGETWIWILPDDDMASPECVEAFFAEAAADKKAEKLYRFQTRHIDDKGRTIYKPPACPPLESNVDFILNKLRFKRNSSVAEYIFSREQYYKGAGFEHLPLAWCADDLLWTVLAGDHNIVTLSRGAVNLRQSDLNISNSKQHHKAKLEAKYLFLEKILSVKAFTTKAAENYPGEVLQQLITRHLFNEYKSYKKKFSLIEFVQYAERNNRILGGGFGRNLYRLIRYQIKNSGH